MKVFKCENCGKLIPAEYKMEIEVENYSIPMGQYIEKAEICLECLEIIKDYRKPTVLPKPNDGEKVMKA